MRARRARDYIAWPLGLDALWLAGPVLALVAVCSVSAVRPFDYFWALVQGRAVVQLGAVPTENLFLYTIPADTPFFNQPWLAQLAMYGAYSVAGHAANVWLLAACLGLSTTLCVGAAVRLGAKPLHVAAVAAFALPFLAVGSGVRTQLFAYPCFALLLRHALIGAPRVTAKSVAFIALVTAVWANVHGTFVLAPLLVVARAAPRVFWEPRASRRPALTGAAIELAAALIAPCLNPRGPLIYAYLATYGSAVQALGKTDVTEWQAVSPTSPMGAALLAATIGLVALVTVRRAWTKPNGALLVLVLAALSLSSQRFLAWWALAAIASVPAVLGRERHEFSIRGAPVVNALLLMVLLAATAAAIPPRGPLFERLAGPSHLPYAGAQVLGRETPWRIAEALGQRGYSGRLFHDQAVGGVLEWTLCERSPRPVAFVDQRFELTPPHVWHDYFTISDAKNGWEERLGRYGIGTLLVHEARQRPLANAAARHADWKLVDREGGYSLYERATER